MQQSFRDLTTLTRHLAGFAHNPRAPKVYTCVCCNYSTLVPVNLRIHYTSKKHKQIEADTTLNKAMDELQV